MAGGGGGGGGGAPVVMSNGGGSSMPPPKGLIDAISEIEQFYVLESNGSEIPDRFLSTKNRLEFFEVGFKGSFLSGLVSAALTPFAIGVLERKIPVFGDADPTGFDKAFVFLLALGFSIGYAAFIGAMGRYYKGSFTRSVIKSFLGGVITGAVLKMVIAFIFFHFISLVVLREERVIWFLGLFQRSVKPDWLNIAYVWIMDFKNIFLVSAWFVVITTIIFIFVPLGSIAYTLAKDKYAMKSR